MTVTAQLPLAMMTRKIAKTKVDGGEFLPILIHVQHLIIGYVADSIETTVLLHNIEHTGIV